ncbi:hypothetical protein SAMN05216378_4575 [Paenibacillus catalpae]|uniref:Uncharacterized protein n=1 Tax=Paenibacillus catalpae TaxID=1045775 RepID=A0A1I2EZ83_9BACL|nr:hypothetical protein SAMN05216378_4575 [Paenibacillus catalpae]
MNRKSSKNITPAILEAIPDLLIYVPRILFRLIKGLLN